MTIFSRLSGRPNYSLALFESIVYWTFSWKLTGLYCSKNNQMNIYVHLNFTFTVKCRIYWPMTFCRCWCRCCDYMVHLYVYSFQSKHLFMCPLCFINLYFMYRYSRIRGNWRQGWYINSDSSYLVRKEYKRL